MKISVWIDYLATAGNRPTFRTGHGRPNHVATEVSLEQVVIMEYAKPRLWWRIAECPGKELVGGHVLFRLTQLDPREAR